jgi:hypothetical protein
MTSAAPGSCPSAQSPKKLLAATPTENAPGVRTECLSEGQAGFNRAIALPVPFLRLFASSCLSHAKPLSNDHAALVRGRNSRFQG